MASTNRLCRPPDRICASSKARAALFFSFAPVGFRSIVSLIFAVLLAEVGPPAHAQTTIGPEGGAVTTSDGSEMIVPAGTFSSEESVSLAPIPQSTLESFLESSLAAEQLTFLGALSVSTGGATYNQSVELLVPNRGELEQGSHLVCIPNWRRCHARAADGCYDRGPAMHAQTVRVSLQRRPRPSAVPSTPRGNVEGALAPPALTKLLLNPERDRKSRNKKPMP